MRTKKFDGWVDGHHVVGRIVEKDETDFEKDRQLAADTGKVIKGIVKVGVGIMILAALASAASPKK